MSRFTLLLAASLALMIGGIVTLTVGLGPVIDAGGLQTFDTRSAGYTLAEARALLAALGPEATAAYRGPAQLADLAFQLGIFGTFALIVFAGFRRLSRPLAVALLAVPAAYLAFDMLENAHVRALLAAGPDGITAQQVARASAATVWKFRLFYAAAALAFAAIALRLGLRKR